MGIKGELGEEKLKEELGEHEVARLCGLP